MRLEPLNVGVIGLGFMGSNHLRVYSEMPAANLVAVADIDELAVQGAIQGHNVRGYTCYREMLEREQLNAVSIVVPTSMHREVALAVISVGISALIEKPIGVDVQEGIEIQNAAASAGVTVTVGHIELFNPAVKELKRLLQEGTIGKLLQIQGRRVGPFQPRRRDVGVVHDLATHDIGVMRFVLGAEITRVHAVTRTGIRTEFADTLFAILEFENEMTGMLDVNWLSPMKARDLQVVGEQGMLSMDYVSQEVRHYQTCGTGLPQSILLDAGGGKVLNVVKREPLRVELEAFLASVATCAPLAADCADAIVTLNVADRLVQSARTGAPVDIVHPLGMAVGQV